MRTHLKGEKKKSYNPHGVDRSYFAVSLILTDTNLRINPYASNNSYANVKEKQIYKINTIKTTKPIKFKLTH